MTTNRVPDLPYELAPKRTAVWTDKNEMIFIDLMAEKVIQSGPTRVIGGFSKHEWNELRVKYYEKCGEKYDDRAHKNKMQTLKDRYKLHKKLIDENTGLGWDSVLNTVDGNQKWWDDTIQKYPGAKRFRTKGCPEYSQLCIIFGDVVAKGSLRASHRHNFNSDMEDDDTQMRETIDPSASHYSTRPSASRQSNHFEETQAENEVHGVEEATSCPTFVNPNTTRRGKKEGKGAEFNESIKMLAESSQARAEERKRKSQEEQKYSLAECMKILEPMEEGLENDAYLRVMELFQDRGWRETFVLMSDKRRRLLISSI